MRYKFLALYKKNPDSWKNDINERYHNIHPYLVYSWCSNARKWWRAAGGVINRSTIAPRYSGIPYMTWALHVRSISIICLTWESKPFNSMFFWQCLIHGNVPTEIRPCWNSLTTSPTPKTKQKRSLTIGGKSGRRAGIDQMTARAPSSPLKHTWQK